MSTNYFSSFTSVKQFKGPNVKHISDLPMAPASGWGRDHLLACLLSEHSDPSDARSSAEIQNFVKGPDSENHFQKSEHSLVRDFGYSISLAQTWAALAAFKGNRDAQRTHDSIDPRDSDSGNHSEDSNTDPDYLMDIESDGGSDSGTRGRPAREVSNATDPEFVHSGEMQVASSSPQASSEGGASSTGHIDPMEYKLRGTVEDDTLRLASCVIRHILYFGPPQDREDMSSVVEFRDAKLRSSKRPLLLDNPMKATDDGGLCLRVQNKEGLFRLRNDRVAILEAKKKFQRLEEGKPTISDECLAQMTCEALLAKLVDSTLAENVIVIHATQHYICFLQFEISDEYLQFFGSDSLDVSISVVATPWFDLSSASNRRQVVLNLCALMRWGGASR
ncbi:unnamed protein product [Penicillium glandicola]